MTSPIFTNEEVNLLHTLRSRTVNAKCNFRNKYLNSLLCPLCQKEDDDQNHLWECDELKKRVNTEDINAKKNVYQDIFTDHMQKEISHLLYNAWSFFFLESKPNWCLQIKGSSWTEIKWHARILLSKFTDFILYCLPQWWLEILLPYCIFWNI